MSLHISSEPCVDNDPNPYNVYFGRGNAVTRNCGTCTYRRIIKANKKLYQEAKGHRGKRQVANDFIRIFHERGGTFYYKEDTTKWWKKAPEQIVLRKVQQALREKEAPPIKRRRNIKVPVYLSAPNSPTTATMDTLSVSKSCPDLVYSPTSPTVQQDLKVDYYSAIDSPHFHQSTINSSTPMIDSSSSISSSSTTTTSEQTYIQNISAYTFRPIDQNARFSQTMTADDGGDNKNLGSNGIVELTHHQPLPCTSSALTRHNSIPQGQIAMRTNQTKFTTTSFDNGVTGGQVQIQQSQFLNRDAHQIKAINSQHPSANLTSNQAKAVPQPALSQKQVDFALPASCNKGEDGQVGLSSYYGSHSLHGNSSMNPPEKSKSLLMQKTIGRFTPVALRDRYHSPMSDDHAIITPSLYDQQNVKNNETDENDYPQGIDDILLKQNLRNRTNYHQGYDDTPYQQNMSDHELLHLTNMDELDEPIEINFSENECIHDDLNLDEIFKEEKSGGNDSINDFDKQAKASAYM